MAPGRGWQRVLDDNPWHPVLVYPPVQVERRHDHGSPVTRSLLPVVVRQDPALSAAPAAVYFLDLDELVRRDAPRLLVVPAGRRRLVVLGSAARRSARRPSAVRTTPSR